MKEPLLTAALGVMCVSAFAQGTFRNMDFEEAQIDQNQPRGVVSADLALPFWTVYYGSTQQTQVHWNELSAGSTWVSLIGQFNPDPVFGGASPIDGGYGAVLIGGLNGPTGGPLECSISQVGELPTDAVSLQFKARGGWQQLTVSVGGVSLPVFELSSVPNQYVVYGVNVSQFAGMQEELRFTAPGFSTGLNGWNIDDIVFSTTPVPEPTAGALIRLGGLLFLCRTCLTPIKPARSIDKKIP